MVFDKEYSSVYDTMYADKDYAGECAYLEKLFKKYGLKPKSLLDLGCGTGSHAVPLAKKGYAVTGVDRSPGMLAAAARKARATGVKLRFIQGDLTKLASPGKFDAVICMFAVMGYQLTNDDLAAVCRLAKESLAPGGVFIFDCWYGPGVLACPPATKIKEVTGDRGERIIRYTTPELDAFKQTVKVNFRVWRVRKDRVSENRESHEMRFFFPQEIAYFLKEAGFRKVDIYPFLETGRKITPADWNMTVAAR
ncbi:MAG: class I SAM-dependent methyltransferase [Elusimicrobia bacterium]|nr:class I SAM-dependent methyltransferase [Elusimicrobiota bacterium]